MQGEYNEIVLLSCIMENVGLSVFGAWLCRLKIRIALLQLHQSWPQCLHYGNEALLLYLSILCCYILVLHTFWIQILSFLLFYIYLTATCYFRDQSFTNKPIISLDNMIWWNIHCTLINYQLFRERLKIAPTLATRC